MAFIPRIKLISSKELPFELHRVQFPVRLAFGMTINKSQGQLLGIVGLDLCNPVFRHGQFYVGVSRGGNWMLHSVQPHTGTPTFTSLHPIPVSKDPCFVSIFSVPNSNLTPLIHFGTLYAWSWPSSPFLPVFLAHPDQRYHNPISDLLIPPCCARVPALFSVVIKASYQCIVESVRISTKYNPLAH